jgi:hypothetical protein
LAQRLIERLQSRPASRVLDFAAGSGRNSEALRLAGFAVVSIDDEDAPSGKLPERARGDFAAVISTHGFLHGTAVAIAARVRSVTQALERGGLFYATFGSTRDVRFNAGERIDDSTFAPIDGDERGVLHTYYDRTRLRALLEPLLEVESLEERRVDDVAGSWAHRKHPLSGAIHWFAVGRRE